jgi:hypothetical protein
MPLSNNKVTTDSNNPQVQIDSGDEDEQELNHRMKTIDQTNVPTSQNQQKLMVPQNNGQIQQVSGTSVQTNKQVDLDIESPNVSPIPNRDHGWSASEGTLLNPTPPFTAQKETSFYTDITQHLLNRTEQTKPPEPETTQDEVDIRSIQSEDILRCTITPFTLETDLPRFDHGCIAFGYFQTLRKILDKSIKARLHQRHLISSFQLRQIPKGMKIIKNISTIEPTPKIKMQHMQILARAEKEMMEISLKHYETAIPKLEKDFEEYFLETAQMAPVDRRLIVLQLLHYKNKLIESKMFSQDNKLDRPGNGRFNDAQGYQPQAPQQYAPQQRYNQQPQGPRPRSPRPPQMRYNNQTRPPPQQQYQQRPQQPRPSSQGQGNWQQASPNAATGYDQPSTSAQQEQDWPQQNQQQNMQWAPVANQYWNQPPKQQRPPKERRGNARYNRY